MIRTSASSLASVVLSSFLVAPCSASPEQSAEEVRSVLSKIKGLLREQVQCLQKITSSEGTKDAKILYAKIIDELMKTHELITEERLILHFAQFPEEEQEVIHIIQELAVEISRLHKDEYYNDSELGALLVPQVDTP